MLEKMDFKCSESKGNIVYVNSFYHSVSLFEDFSWNFIGPVK
jgi:hypothetical protein